MTARESGPPHPFKLLTRFWRTLTRFVSSRRANPRDTEEILLWSMARAVHLWNETSHTDGSTFSEYILKSGVNIPARVMRMRAWVVIAMFAWPVLAWLIVHKHKGQRSEQWARALLRPDLYAAFSRIAFSGEAVRERRSDMVHAIVNAWDYSTGRSSDYTIEDKRVFEERARQASLPVVHSLSLEDARRLGGPFIVKDPGTDMGLGVSLVSTFDELTALLARGNLLVQAPISNHSQLRAILPKHPPLCTLRLVTTRVSGQTHCHIAYFRIGASDAAIDNLSRGGTLVEVDLSSGRLLNGVVYDALQGKVAVGAGIQQIPGADQPFAGRELPLFVASVDLVKRAHQTIAPSLISIGWDVALTDGGPVLVEANVYAGSYEILQFNDSYELGNRAILERINAHTNRR